MENMRKRVGTGNVDEILVKFRESQKKAEAVKGKENVSNM